MKTSVENLVRREELAAFDKRLESMKK